MRVNETIVLMPRVKLLLFSITWLQLVQSLQTTLSLLVGTLSFFHVILFTMPIVLLFLFMFYAIVVVREGERT